MKQRKIIHPLKSLILVLFAAILLAACSSRTADNSAPVNRDLVKAPVDSEDLTAPVPQVKNSVEQINKENFDQIKNGMSYSDVAMLIAGDDKKTTSVKKDGVLKETYRWELEDGSKYIEVLFEDEKVVGKNQKGLK